MTESGNTEAGDLEAFQAEVAWTALAAIGGHGFALAGAGALIAHGLVDRLTQDLDLFSPLPGGAGQVTATLQQALLDAGFQVTVDSTPTSVSGDFARLEVTRGDRSVQIDLGRDWRQHPPIILAVGPVLALDDAVGNKVGAMIGRGLPRDYLDVAAALRRYDRGQLLELGFRRDPGLRVVDVALAMRRLDQIPDRQFAVYDLTPGQGAAARAAFRHWPREPSRDVQGDRAHLQATQPLAPEPPLPHRCQPASGSAHAWRGDPPPPPGPGPTGPTRPGPARGPRR